MTLFKDLAPEIKARVKEAENIIRFETWCGLKGIPCTHVMKEEVRAGCRDWYRTNENSFIPSKTLLSFSAETRQERAVLGELQEVKEEMAF